jgi:hypothetical protein
LYGYYVNIINILNLNEIIVGPSPTTSKKKCNHNSINLIPSSFLFT